MENKVLSIIWLALSIVLGYLSSLLLLIDPIADFCWGLADIFAWNIFFVLAYIVGTLISYFIVGIFVCNFKRIHHFANFILWVSSLILYIVLGYIASNICYIIPPLGTGIHIIILLYFLFLIPPIISIIFIYKLYNNRHRIKCISHLYGIDKSK